MTYESLFPDGADLCKLRVLLYLYSPSLVVRDMPVELVKLMDFHDVDIFLHHVHVEEMSGHIHMHAPVAESRCVIDLGTWNCPLQIFCRCCTENLHGKHLPEGLHCIVHTP